MQDTKKSKNYEMEREFDIPKVKPNQTNAHVVSNNCIVPGLGSIVVHFLWIRDKEKVVLRLVMYKD